MDQGKKVLENKGVKLLWDLSIQTEAKIDHNKPDILYYWARKRKSVS